ncbi:hypothetical protein PVAND_013399 [Polypedilum vanderplanki]|uniref:CLIP domain-containing serine protease n=1 Tax=Polypedilum vanderplanki TaxID=319348 RepID=A0A9J6CRA3_POLVA|nr:hypothetical protein PVAND_013399 [Polypedilum vanderplanki]
MSKVIGALSLVLVILIICDAQVEPDCVTPDNLAGACVNVRYCVSIMTALINNDHLTNPAVAKFLRESQCGLAINSHMVCCNIQNVDFGVTPAVTLPVISAPPPSTTRPTSFIHTEQQTPPPVTLRTPTETITSDCGKLRENEAPFKWIAELWFKHDRLGGVLYEAKCLGIVISSKHIILPAHCVAALPANVSLSHAEIDSEEYAPSKILIHLNYNQPKFANDIAIIELATEVNNVASAVCLDVSTASDSKSTIAIMKNEESEFKYGRIAFINDNQCSEFFQQQFTDLTTGQFCANIQLNNGSAAYNTFIGAIILNYDTLRQQYSLKGFTSTAIRTEQAFDESKPYVFTDVEQQLSWIKSAIGEVQSNNDEKLKSCQLPNELGRCVLLEHCTLYRDAPRPLSKQQEIFLEQIKCSTELHSNQIEKDDGICCPESYVNQTMNDEMNFDIDERFRVRRGLSLLNIEKCGKVDASRRIVGGERADLREFPWHALIKYKIGRIFKYTCASSLISTRYALTCAHCITQLPARYEIVAVRLGEYDLTTDPDCQHDDDTGKSDCNPPVQDIEIERLIPHSLYNNPRFSNDIGLVRMARDAEISQSVIPICLPVNQKMYQVLSNKYTVTGFGLTESGRDSDTLLKILVPKVSRETCQSFHRSVIQLAEGHTCYGGEGIIDSCKGDSGGPLINYVIVDGTLKAVQMGIVASGHSDCGRGIQGYPGIYTDVKFYMNWILDNIEE